MKDNPPWLFLEPYVHVIRQESDVLLYNTISKTVLEFSNSLALSNVADELLVPANGYVIPLSPSQLQDTEVRDFLHQIRQHFMGDLLDPSWSDGKPVNIFPEPFVRHGLNPVPVGQSPLKPGLEGRNYLQELTLFLNAGPDEAITPFAKTYLQFSYPSLVSEKEEQMDFHLFHALIDDVNHYTPTLIHISGMNLLAYPHLENVIRQLASSPFQKKYHLQIDHWVEQFISLILLQKQTTLSLYITFPTHPELIAGYLQSLPDLKLLKKLEYNLLVSNQEELQMALEIIKILDLRNVYLKPVYTGENLDFFRQNVFVSREEILAAQPDQQQVFSRISINENDFGKLSVFPGGEVCANLNDPRIGNATKSTLVQLVALELERGVSWRRTRASISPCKTCLYQFLCPPISSYEIFLKRYNFCDVCSNGEES
ncbi:MAG: TIGR04150 pseudo-rSAM protein [Bacteroidales bacterium]|nr:TIGR04150 pseudo-rSAM protein [Bacteroidales bacterium]